MRLMEKDCVGDVDGVGEIDDDDGDDDDDDDDDDDGVDVDVDLVLELQTSWMPRCKTLPLIF